MHLVSCTPVAALLKAKCDCCELNIAQQQAEAQSNLCACTMTNRNQMSQLSMKPSSVCMAADTAGGLQCAAVTSAVPEP